MKKIIFILLFVSKSCFAQFSTFKPAVFQPVKRDISVLLYSLDKIEQRKNDAYDYYNKLITALAEYGSLLNNDESTLIWFNQYKNKIIDSFYSLSGTCGWEAARDYAIRKLGDVATDPELQARIRTAKEYHSILSDIKNCSDMSQEDKVLWIQKNPYCFIPIVNSSNQIVGGKLGTTEELNAYRAEEEEERKKRIEEEQERQRLYAMAHPFDNFDYSNYDIIIDNPQYVFKNSKYHSDDIKITRIALSSSETRVEFVENITSYSCNVKHDTYIIAPRLNKLFLINAENIAIAPYKRKYNNDGEILKFALIFPALPKNTKKFSLRENDRNGWKFSNIKIQ